MARTEIDITGLAEYVRVKWRPVHASFHEGDCSNPLKIVTVDLICEWRLHDRKAQFVKVPYDTDEELARIRDILLGSISLLSEALKKNFDSLLQGV